MSRNKNNLTARQQLFFNELVRGKPFNEILQEHRIRPATLMRWTTESNFVDQWKICNQVLALRRQADESCAIRLTHAAQSSIVTTGTTTAPAASPPPPPPPDPALEIKPLLSEREAIRARHGEEAACAFDRLMQLRERRDRSANAPPPPTASPPPPAAAPDSPQAPNAITALAEAQP
jgi:hypothetical protein